ncbi:RND multidrug efflux transporter [Lachnospiraceae bacterium TWA4]|nr:RND multidrug efflux transporter [Lachnospiraceae bacterium TWA4]
MISRYSVKKPFTVLVGIVMILILGYVSFTRMTTDLLPSMEFPYAIVMTTYPGASPDEIETTVTSPIESSMATLDNIKNISSVSNENYSMVILEFEDNSNMDTLTIDMREKLDQLKSTFNDSIGSPIIMKLNPDMMPVMVSAIYSEEYNGKELTDFVNENIIPNLESIEGVASVSASGTITEDVQVIIRQSKINQLNKKIKNAINGKFKDAEDELNDSKKELENGKNELENGKQQAANQMASAEQQINDNKDKLLTTEADLKSKLQQVESGLTSITQQEAQLKSTEQTVKTLTSQLKQATENINQIDEDTTLLNQLRSRLDNLSDEDQATLSSLGLTEFTTEAIDEQIASLNSQRSTLESTKATIQSTIDGVSNMGLVQIENTKAQLETNKKQLENAKSQLTSALSQIETGKISLNQAISELNKERLLASIEMATANAQISSGQQQLDAAQKTIDDQKDSAYDQSDANKLVTISMVENLLTAQNFSMPAGYITEDGTSYLVRVGDDFETTQDMKDLVLMDMNIDGLEPIKLSDVADVIITDNSDKVYTKVNGNSGLMLTMQKQTGYSTGEVSDRILDKFESLKKQYTNIGFITLMDQGIYIDMVINSVLKNLLYGAVLAIIVLLIFLKDLRPTIAVAFSIPVSILTAIVLMYFSHVSLNIISLSGLALGVGMLVDNSIVVIENIYRLRSEGYSAKKAAVEGARTMAGAITASTLTTVCVFLPIVFTEGLTRQIFVDMGLTIAYSLLASLLIALTLVPVMSASMLKNPPKEKKTWIIGRLQEGYGAIMPTVLKLKPVILIGSLVLVILSVYLASTNGTALIPEMGSTQISLSITTDEDSTFEDTSKIGDEAIKRIQSIDGVTDVGAMMGGGSGMSSMASMLGQSDGTTNKLSFYILTDENSKKTNKEFGKEIEDQLKDLDCTYELSTTMMDTSAMYGSGISIQIKGRDLDKLQTIASDMVKLLENVEGAVNVKTSAGEPTDEIRLTIDKNKAIKYQLTTAQIFQSVNSKLSTATSKNKLSTDTYDYNIIVSKDTDEDLTKKTLKEIKLTGTDSDGKSVELPITDLVSFEDAHGLQSISRDDQSRYINVTAEIDENHNIGLVSNVVNERLKEVTLPEGYTYSMEGEDESINEAMSQVGLMLALALAFMYLIMVAQFQSLLSPFIIMFTIPLAFTGGFAALFLTGNEISLIAMIGFVMLSGIIVNNGIVMVDSINQLRREGMNKKDAIRVAGTTRLRPILMTALTTILGLSAMVFSTDIGSAMSKPMAIVTIGGLIYGTLLTLFVVPCIYDLFNRNKDITEEEL